MKKTTTSHIHVRTQPLSPLSSSPASSSSVTSALAPPSSSSSSSAIGGVVTNNKTEQLIVRLCSKIAHGYSLHDKLKDEFIRNNFEYATKLLSSDTYAPNCEAFEVSQKIKKFLTAQNRIIDSGAFVELETRLSRQRIIADRAPLLQFFYIYLSEHDKYEYVTQINSAKQRESLLMREAPRLNENVNENIVDKSAQARKIADLFKKDKSSDLIRDHQRLKPVLVANEGQILRELIYALQGLDGKLFQKDPKDAQSIIIKVEMEKSAKMHVQRHLEFGWLYLRLRKFLATYNNSSNSSSGLVLQAFCAFISAELKEVHCLLAVLESQLNNNAENNTTESNLSLRRLSVWLDQPFDRLKYLNIVCDAVKDKKGGVLLSTLYSYSIHGDPFKSSLLKSALSKCAIPIRDMIVEWVCDGAIRDQHEEFFVGCDNTVSDDRLWQDKYNLRHAQIPSFISEQQAKKILVIGKSINFLRGICNEQKKIKAMKNIPSSWLNFQIESMLDQKTDSQFQDMIDLSYADTSSTLMNILMKKYKLLDHFSALRRYLLLGQGDFIRHLMDLMEKELNKPANHLMFHTLQRLLDKAVTETNAQYDPAYIISCLDVKLLTTSPNDVGWDVFSLDYSLDGPLKTIFTVQIIYKYLKVFNFLWRVKRMEYTTCATWRSHKADADKLRTIPEIYEVIHQCNITSSEMLRLIQNLNFYIMFEVLEVSWKDLDEKLKEAKDMDDVMAAHDKFLEKITSQLLLDQKSSEIASEIRTIFDLIVKMCNLIETFHKLAKEEYDMRAVLKKIIQEKANTLTEAEFSVFFAQNEEAEKRRFHNEVKPKIKNTNIQTALLRTSFSDMVKKLLEMLKNHHNESLRFLSFRFNFNEYYTERTTTSSNGHE